MFEPKFFREENYYSFEKFKELFKDKDVLNHLLKKDIIKFSSNESYFKFKYVGVIIIGDELLYCYPKYIYNEDNIFDDFKQTLKVIKKFHKQNDIIFYENDEYNESQYSLLSLMLFFIEDYYENGVYTKTQDILEVNGNGEIDWNRTVNESIPIFRNGKPYYHELQTRYKQNDLHNYFRLLHKCIITKCSKCLEYKELLDLFDLNTIELSQKNLNDFGDKNYIKERLEKELNVEFNTHKRKLLKAMISYISESNETQNTFLSLYGSNEYYNIWEKMCSKVLHNNLDDNLMVLFNDESLDDKKLKEYISHPIMHLDGKKIDFKRLIPDLIIFNKIDNQFIVLDAKYRNLRLNDVDEKLKLYDVNKQYLYQLAYCKLLKTQNIECVKNALLFPTYENEVKNRGFIEFEMFDKLGIIQLIELPANKINKLFLEGEEMDLKDLELKDSKSDYEDKNY